MASACVNIGRCDVVEALVISLMIVVPDEGGNERFEIIWQEVVFQQNSVLQRLMPSFNLALCLRMIGRPACVRHAFVFQILGQISGDIAWTIV